MCRGRDSSRAGRQASMAHQAGPAAKQRQGGQGSSPPDKSGRSARRGCRRGCLRPAWRLPYSRWGQWRRSTGACHMQRGLLCQRSSGTGPGAAAPRQAARQASCEALLALKSPHGTVHVSQQTGPGWPCCKVLGNSLDKAYTTNAGAIRQLSALYSV